MDKQSSPNVIKFSQLVKQKRESGDYTIRKVAKRIGISPTHYGRIENGKIELSDIRVIYGISRELEIPINLLIKTYLDLSDEDERWCFTIDFDKPYDSRNAKVLYDARMRLSKERGNKVAIQEIADFIEYSKCHYWQCENGNRSFKNIYTLFKLSKYLKVPLYVFIRNELGLTDDELIKVINIPDNDTRIKVIFYLEDNEVVELKKKLIASIIKLEKNDLQVIERILSAFEKNEVKT